jgi:hypothetical protein
MRDESAEYTVTEKTIDINSMNDTQIADIIDFDLLLKEYILDFVSYAVGLVGC